MNLVLYDILDHHSLLECPFTENRNHCII